MVVIFQHVPFEGPGIIADMLEGRGVPFTTIHGYEGETVPHTPAGYSGVISMGGPMSANDDLPYLAKEKSFLAQALERDLPVMGICLGAQLLAASVGGTVYPGSDAEVGWGEVSLTDEGRTDPVFAAVQDPLPVLHWHSETFDLPEGSVLLASSDKYANQAFRLGDSGYGLQFHLEATDEMVKEWVEEDGEADAGIVPHPDRILSQAPAYLSRIQLNAALVFGRFLDMLLKV
ncbi:type 1 glutamine amidotransferase, partial [bacterium]